VQGAPDKFTVTGFAAHFLLHRFSSTVFAVAPVSMFRFQISFAVHWWKLVVLLGHRF
jgi:hypothetical protein